MTDKKRVQLPIVPAIEVGSRNTRRTAFEKQYNPSKIYFVSDLTKVLAINYQCQITDTFYDQWFGISAETEYEDIFVPCDYMEDGLLAIWDYLASK